jgi:hypothetical protein
MRFESADSHSGGRDASSRMTCWLSCARKTLSASVRVYALDFADLAEFFAGMARD